MSGWLNLNIGADSAIQKLIQRGYLAHLDLGVDMSEVVKEAQKTLGVQDVDGVLGPETWRALNQPKYCGLPDQVRIGGLCKWPENPIYFCIEGKLPGISADEYKGTVIEASNKWNSVCGVKLEYTANRKTANFEVITTRIDGKYGVLADSSVVPCGLSKNAQFDGRQRYDEGEPFYPGFTRPPAGKISLGMVVLHEEGHMLGEGHLASGVLHASYQFIEGGFVENDLAVASMVKRYGPPKQGIPPITPRPPVDQPSDQKPLFTLGGWRFYRPARAGDRYSVTK